MIRPCLPGRALSIVLLVVLAGSGSLAADWLVTLDGQRIETRGPWKVKGNVVVFTLPSGTFSSLRLNTVDLDASRNTEKMLEEQRKAEARAGEIEKEPAKPVLELTDADLPRRNRIREEEPADEIELLEQQVEKPKAAGPSISVASWEKVDNGDDGFEIVGSFRNTSSKMASAIELTVLLFDEEGVIVDAVGATLTSASLGPDEQGQFSANFETARDFAAMKFDVSSFDIESNDE